MEIKQTPISGISRFAPLNSQPEGACNDIINLRPKNGAWRPILKKTAILSNVGEFDTGFTHNTSQGQIILLWVQATGELRYIFNNVTVPLFTIQSEDLNIESIGNILIVSSPDKLYYFVWDGGAYTNLSNGNPDLIKFVFAPQSIRSERITTENLKGLTFDEQKIAIEGELYKTLKEKGEKGRLYGYVVVQYAYEMFDGSFVKHSNPQIVWMGGTVEPTTQITRASASVKDATSITIMYPFADLGFSLSPGFSSILEPLKASHKDIIKGIAIFISRPNLGYMFDGSIKSGNTDEALNQRRSTSGTQTQTPAASPDFIIDKNATAAELLKQNFYKVTTISLEDIKAEGIVQKLDIGNLEHIVTKEPMTIDEYSHHGLGASYLYVYNNRLLLGGLKVSLFKGYSPAFFTNQLHEGSSREIMFEFELTTGDGKKIVRTNPVQNDHAELFLPLVISYPDSRATMFRVLVRKTGNIDYRVLYSLKLEAHPFANMAFGTCLLPTKPVNVITYDGAVEVRTTRERVASVNPVDGTPIFVNSMGFMAYPSDESTLELVIWQPNEIVNDLNRVQATKTNNPFLFPAANSYRVGKSQVIGMASNAIPVSTGQFGQYPLFVFTQSGIWALTVGAGEVFIETISPLNDEVCNNAKSITQLSKGSVVFTTEQGLIIMAGGEVHNISKALEGEYHKGVSNTAKHAFFINNEALTSIPEFTEVDIREYLRDCIIGYDKENNEIVVSNPAFAHSFAFSMDANVWTSFDQVFSRFIKSFPLTLAKSGTNIVTLSQEEGEAATVYLQTQPATFGSMAFKIAERSILTSDIGTLTGKYAALYLYGSVDGVNWLMLGGIQKGGRFENLMLNRSLVSVKYFVYVFTGVLTKESYLNSIVSDIKVKQVNKLR